MPLSEKQQKLMDKRDNKVIAVLGKRTLGFADLQTKTGFEPNHLRGALARLRKSKKIKKLGTSRDATYALVPR